MINFVKFSNTLILKQLCNFIALVIDHNTQYSYILYYTYLIYTNTSISQISAIEVRVARAI